jgi:hypothetical protein
VANSFTDFKDRYAGRPTQADKLTEKMISDMLKLYEATYNKIYRELSVARKEVNYPTYAKRTQLLKQIGEQLDGFKTTFGSKLGKALKQIAWHGTHVAIKDLELLGADLTKAEEWHYEYNEKFVEQTFADNFKHIAAQTAKMKRDAKTLLQSEAIAVFRRAAVEGLTRKEAYRQLKAAIMEKDPEFQFVDKAGRRWGSDKYFDMLTKTVMANAANEAYVNTLLQEGHDLVKVNINGAKDACRNWEGRILSLTGATKEYTTLDEAKVTGEVFHPRCKHRLLAYHPDIEEVFEAAKAGKSNKEILGE